MKVFLRTISLSLVILLGVLAWRTYQFTPPEQGAVEPLSKESWDSAYLAEGLAEAIRYPTVSNKDSQQVDRQAFADFRAFLTERFPLVFQRIPHQVMAGDSLLFRWAGDNRDAAPILLLAHQDVVPVIPGTEQEWAYPPFAGVIAEGHIWGRGAVDDKASVMGILEAVERLLKEGFTPPRDIYLAFGHDEEVGGRGAVAMAQHIADSGEKLAFLLDEGGVIARGMMAGVSRPIALIGPGEKGYVSLKLTARGTGGHSSMPPQQTAAGIIAAAVSRLENNPMPARLDMMADLIRYLGDEIPWYQRVLFANEWLFAPLLDRILRATPTLNAGIRTTTAVTMLEGSVQDNVLPITASAVVNFRIIPGETVELVTQRVIDIIDDPRVSVSPYGGFGSNPSSVAAPDSAGFNVLSDIVRQVNPNVVVTPRLVVAATDARHFEGVAENSYRFIGIELGPEEIAGIHGTNERVAVDSYRDAVQVYYQLIRRSREL
ncbi:M20/M25/M40 family metallo-hydrolase [Spongiibacter sp. KMU-166]|uniref:M20/M25/M40 family metallo-hydrolase n=1 Tax=Spongiibacter thalassae TaxID=2721624 RepID=A0ABX1GBZ4_9GAMM|nr:M20 family peptidase [Spongiibacter thalassae]NKI16456.1 M20/M25/M40 family metallo-hydrolase [Spongiibacter thalassae]